MAEEVLFIRGDQYSFVLQGVTRYHTPLDNMDQPIDFMTRPPGSVMNFLVG